MAMDGEMVPIKKWITYSGARPIEGPTEQGQWINDNGGFDRDLSILVLAKKVQFTNKVQPICLPNVENKDISNTVTFVSGWGNTKLRKSGNRIEDYGGSDIPKRSQMIVITKRNCSANYRYCQHCQKSTMICATANRKYNVTINEDACRGDSGGKIFDVFKTAVLCIEA